MVVKKSKEIKEKQTVMQKNNVKREWDQKKKEKRSN